MSIRLSRPPQTDDELYWTVKALWGITIPRGRSTHPQCADHVPPFVAFADAYFNRDSITDPDNPRPASMALWHGSRGLSGKSFTLSALGIVKPTFLGCDVNLLGGSMNQSKNIHEHVRKALEYRHAPSYMVDQEGNELIRLSNKARIRPLTASQRTVRGPHPPFLILDEIDEMELSILDAALGQPMPQINYLGETIQPYTVMCSTWQNPDGTFTEVLRRAEERGWPIYRWCYHCSANPEDGWLSPEHIERQKNLISAEMWRVEYELGEPSIGNRAVDTDAIDAVFCRPFDAAAMVEAGKGRAKGKPLAAGMGRESKDFAEYMFADPDNDHEYVVAADWGKEQDYTVIGVLAVPKNPARPVHLAYYARMNRRPYPMMIRYFNDAIKRFKPRPQHAIHDKTGLGNVVHDLVDVRATGFTFSGPKRIDMLTDYVAALEQMERFELPAIPTLYSEHKYCRTGDLYHSGSKEYHTPDTFAMMAMANRVIRRMRRHQQGGASNFRKNAGAVPRSTAPTRLAAHLDGDATEQQTRGITKGRTGDVVKRTTSSPGGYNLTV